MAAWLSNRSPQYQTALLDIGLCPALLLVRAFLIIDASMSFPCSSTAFQTLFSETPRDRASAFWLSNRSPQYETALPLRELDGSSFVSSRWMP